MAPVRNNKGFTLVELIIVLVVLALLAAILVPTLSGYIAKSRDERNMQTAETVRVAVQSEATQLLASGDLKSDSTEFSSSEGEYAQYSDEVLQLAGLSAADVTSWSFSLDKTEPYSGNVVIDEVEYYYANNAWSTMSGVSSGLEPGQSGEEQASGSEAAQGTAQSAADTQVAGASYVSQKVAVDRKNYLAPVDAVIKTLYEQLVSSRLSGDTSQRVSRVILNASGQVESVKFHGANKSNMKGIDKRAVGEAIRQALASTGYKMSGAGQVYFDLEGNVTNGMNKRSQLWFRSANDYWDHPCMVFDGNQWKRV